MRDIRRIRTCSICGAKTKHKIGLLSGQARKEDFHTHDLTANPDEYKALFLCQYFPDIDFCTSCGGKIGEEIITRYHSGWIDIVEYLITQKYPLILFCI